MPTPTDETTFLSQALAWIAAGVAGIGAWLWLNTMGRISRLEESKVNQKTFDEYVARADKDRGERRETEISLFKNINDLRIHVDSRLDKIVDILRERK